MSAFGFRVVLRSLRYPQKFRGHEESWVCAQAHISLPRFYRNTGRLCSAGSGCRARSPPSSLVCSHPTPHAASACLRSALGYALPVVQTLVLCLMASPPRGRPSVRLQPTARRSGSPVLRRPVSTTGRSGVSQVTGPSSSAVPQSSTPPVPLRLAVSASGDAAFMVAKPLSIRDEHFEAAIPVAQLARLTTHQPPPHGDDCKSSYQPAG